MDNNQDMLSSVINSLGIYARIEGDNGFIYSNIPGDFKLADECKYNGNYYVSKKSDFTCNDIKYTIVSYSDVTDLKKKINEDAKTGILSLTGFKEEIKELSDNKDSFVLGMFDVDCFKSINDNYGHDIGDQVLTAVAQMFRHNIKIDDFVGRFGGDEFVFVMKNMDLDNAKERTEELNKRLNSGLHFNNNINLPLSLSIGIVEYDNDITFNENLRLADELVYLSKNQGKNRVNISSEKSHRSIKR